LKNQKEVEETFRKIIDIELPLAYDFKFEVLEIITKIQMMKYLERTKNNTDKKSLAFRIQIMTRNELIE
jgi:hypothetical protein